MAQNLTVKDNPKGKPHFNERSTFWSDLQYIPVEYKNEYWAAQNLYFFKKNARLFLDPARARQYRSTDDLKLDDKEYKQMFDPITPMGNGGTANYVAADWKSNPIYIHLKNVVKAEIQRTSKQLEVNLTDKYALTRKQKDSQKIFYSRLMRQVINSVNKELGKMPLTESQDPFKYIASQAVESNKKKGQDPSQEQQPSEITSNFNDMIKNAIESDQDLALYMELIYKGDYEIALEKGIDYYMMNLNKWNERWSDEFIDDIMHFNKACGEWYTDLVTGRPVIERFVPELTWVSPFKRKDGEDLMYYFTEYSITFADFVKTIGANLDKQKLKDVFEYNKTQGSCHGFDWLDMIDRPNRMMDNAMIRVGRAACLTQDYDVDMDAVVPNYPQTTGDGTGITWETGMDKEPKMPQSTKHYNVWYSFYYIPPTTQSLSNADYAWQAQFIFDIKKNQDQLRTGEDGRYSKPPLFIYDNGKQASFTDMVMAYMPKINYAWFQYQNCLVNDIEATVLSDELIGGLLGAVDESNKISTGLDGTPTGGNGVDAYKEQWRMIRQSGTGFLKLTDRQGNQILDPNKLFFHIKNGLIEKAEKYMSQMMLLYQQMTQSLAMTDAREGQDTKPRTSVAAIEESLKASNNATWFIQKAYEELLKTVAERMIRYMLEIMREAKEYGYTKRRQEFFDIVGESYGLLVEGLENIPPESIGMNINYVDNTAKKDLVFSLATELVKNNQLDFNLLYLLMGADNWKQSMCLMRMGIKSKEKEKAHQEELQHERQMQLQQEQQKSAMMMLQAQTQSKVAIDTNVMKLKEELEQVKGQIKTMSQSMLLDQRGGNKISEAEAKARLEEAAKEKAKLPPMQ